MHDLIIIIGAIFGCTGFWALIQAVVIKLMDRKSVGHKALLGLLHDRIFEISNKCIEKGYITVNEYNNLISLYEPYSKLGGNGTARMLKEEVDNLPKQTTRQ